ncbi:MAG: hypothetical protein ABIA47_05145 [bacterium]
MAEKTALEWIQRRFVYPLEESGYRSLLPNTIFGLNPRNSAYFFKYFFNNAPALLQKSLKKSTQISRIYAQKSIWQQARLRIERIPQLDPRA